jgi:hypothetical protein
MPVDIVILRTIIDVLKVPPIKAKVSLSTIKIELADIGYVVLPYIL